jgi:hypothetical protein
MRVVPINQNPTEAISLHNVTMESPGGPGSQFPVGRVRLEKKVCMQLQVLLQAHASVPLQTLSSVMGRTASKPAADEQCLLRGSYAFPPPGFVRDWP